MADITQDFLRTSLHNFVEQSGLDGTFVLEFDFLCGRLGNLLHRSICHGMLDFQFFSFVLFNGELRHDIFGQVLAAQRQHRKLPENIALENRNGGGTCSHVQQNTSRTTFRVGKQHVGQSQRRYGLGHNIYGLETMAHIFTQLRTGYDVYKTALDVIGQYTDGIGLKLSTHFILLRNDVQNFLVGHSRRTIDIEQRINQFMGNTGLRVQLLGYGILYRMYSFTAQTQINLIYSAFERLLEFADNIIDALRGLVRIKDGSFPDKRGRGFLRQGENLYATVRQFMAGDARNF